MLGRVLNFPCVAVLCLSRTYNVELDSIMVGSSLIHAGIQALFDTGTAFTYLATSLYTTFVQDVIALLSYLACVKTGLPLH